MISNHADLTGKQQEQVRDLADAAHRADGVAPLNEASLLALSPGTREDAASAPVTHLLATAADQITGYAQLEQLPATGDSGPTATAQLVVHPDHRRTGIGTALLEGLVAAREGGLQVWAMGDGDAAQTLADHAGLTRNRELLIMRRPLTGLPPSPPTPEGVTVRTFVVGQDEGAWLELNARAFAHHPEQGRMTRADLDARIAEDWFDPAGFFLAERTGQGRHGQVIGFHWTKQHPEHVGEVYVLAVDPDASGGGLGKVLLGRGLAHLAAVGNTEVLLYVEGDHERAVGLYAGQGFTVANRDVMYAERA